jgi:hypothetical protein
MTHDWMNDPELDQLPTSPKQNLDGLKQLAARESSANDLPAPAVPSHYAMSMAELKAQRAATLPTSHPVQPAPAKPAKPAPAPAPATITSTALIELSTLVGIAQSSESPEALLPECARLLERLGEELGAVSAFGYVAGILRDSHERATEKASPHDRFGAVELAIELRQKRHTWDEVVRMVNEAGYRNQRGGLWKFHALRRSTERYADKIGVQVTKRRST